MEQVVKNMNGEKNIMSDNVKNIISLKEAEIKITKNKNIAYEGIDIQPNNKGYKQYAKDVLETIKELNKQARTDKTKFNTEQVPNL